MLNVTHTLLRLANTHVSFFFSLTALFFGGEKGRDGKWRINAFFIIIDSLHFSAGSESNLCLNISSLPLGASLVLGQRPGKK